MGDRITIAGTTIPDPGATITAAMVHSIVDNATVTIDTDGLTVGEGNILSVSTYTSLNASLQKLGEEMSLQHNTAASMPGIAIANVLQKGGVGFWSNFYGPADVPAANMCVKGLPAYQTKNTPRGGAWGPAEWADGGRFVGGSKFRLAPLLNQDPRWANEDGTAANNDRVSFGGYRTLSQYNWEDFVIPQENSASGATYQNIGIAWMGMTEVLVHYSLSDSFEPGALYAMYHTFDDGGVHDHFGSIGEIRVPIAWAGTDPTAASGTTSHHNPWGTIREVYTGSGVTNVQMPNSDTSYSLGPQPFYVAKAWFWGEPCL